MKITNDSLKAHDYTKKLRTLLRKSAAIKKKSQELNEMLSATLKKCAEILHSNKNKEK